MAKGFWQISRTSNVFPFDVAKENFRPAEALRDQWPQEGYTTKISGCLLSVESCPDQFCLDVVLVHGRRIISARKEETNIRNKQNCFFWECEGGEVAELGYMDHLSYVK